MVAVFKIILSVWNSL